jgi:protein-S-isoprenylcysteine O-methyltransferase Ste14
MTFFGVGPKILLVSLVCFAATIILHYLFRSTFAIQCIPGWWLVVTGCVLSGMGLCLWILAGREVGRAFKSGQLVTNGFYALCRNPVYTAELVWITGLALLFRSWILLAVPLVTYVTARILVRKEEEYLKEKFGQDYLEYMKRVRPFLPGLPKR